MPDEADCHPETTDADAADHSAFDLLNTGVQRQLYSMKWPSLRPIQVRAIKSFLDTDRHLLLTAETAAGKTEAAFLPILSAVADEPMGSVRAVYVGPLKALINDQFSRVEELCTHIEMPVHRWHGDVGASRKAALIKQPSGILLITPESLESLLVNRTAHLENLFGGLRAIVIDELHAFLTGERGLHLASLLTRIARYRTSTEPPARLVGLSATIGDPGIAQSYLCPGNPEKVEIIADDGDASEIKLRVHGYDAWELATEAAKSSDHDSEEVEHDLLVSGAIAQDLVEHCRTHSNLVFANAKGDIEILADMANECCEMEGLPKSFLVHHGSLSKEVREDSEAQMKSGRLRTTICSSTLEMGIDIGSVRLIGQIGAPWSAASLKQRMGRSGRNPGDARRLRCYVDCTTIPEPSNPISLLPVELLQTVAIIELMLEGWVEPQGMSELDLSTLTHQIISTIAELGAISAVDLYCRLCQEGPFDKVSQDLCVRLLRGLGAADIIEQGADGLLILGLIGEKLRSRKDFYAAFASRTEFSVIAGSRTLGTLPIDALPKPGDHLVFAARRWQVTSVDIDRHELYVSPAKRRKKPIFLSSGGMVHHQVIERMMGVIGGQQDIPYLDAAAKKVISTARDHARSHDLSRRRRFALNEKKCVWLTWSGTAETMAYEALLASEGIESRSEIIGLVCDCKLADLDSIINKWITRTPDLMTLAMHIQPKRRRKYDEYLPDDLLEEGIASDLVWRGPI